MINKMKNITPKVIFLGTIIFLVSFVSTEKVSELLFSRNQLAQVGSTTQGLVGYWNFNEGSGNSAADTSGNNATASSSKTVNWIPGKQGSAVSFNTYPAFSAPSNLGITNFPFTLSVWSKPTGVNGPFNPALALGRSGTQYFGIGWSYDNLPAISGRNTTSRHKNAQAVSATDWVHLVGVFNSPTDRKLYVNGVLAATDTNSVPSIPDPSNVFIGATSYLNEPNMDVDEARIYNRALSVSEILDIYNASYSTITPPTTVPLVISNVASSGITSTDVSISWTTNLAADSQVEYGLTTSYGSSSSLNSSLITSHSIYLSSLSPNTLYHFRVKSRDASSELVISGDFTFTTLSITTPPPITPPITPPPFPPTTTSAPTGNGVTIKDTSGQDQIDQAFTISRVFKQGDIFQYPKARVGGTTTLTQADVKSRWPDGSVKHVMISFITSIPANQAVFVDFINQNTSNTTGELTKSEMLNYNGGAWGGKIQTSIGSADARAMLSSWDGTDTGLNGKGVRYWLKGPIVTQVIVEDKTPSLAYDFGEDSFKSLHPIFVLTFYPGTNTGVKIDYILENMWTTKLQDQSYDLTLLAGNPANTSVYTKSTFNHIAKTRWRKTFWSGQAPKGWVDLGHPGISVNYNFPYITSSYVLPNFDMSKTVSTYDINNTINSFNGTDKGDVMGQGKWTARKFESLDDHSESTLVPMYYARYLYTFNPELYAVMIGQAGVSAHIPVHLRESATGMFFDSGRSVDAFGLPMSLDARPNTVSRINTSSSLPLVGPLTEDGWNPDLAHQPSFTYVPYLITGDWYYLEETNFWSSYNLARSGNDVRHSSWGILVGQGIQTRGEARGLLPVGHSAFMSPDGSYEKNYYTEKLYNNIAVREGQHNITDGAFYEPCTASNPFVNEWSNTTKWCWGRNVEYAGMGKPNPLHYPSPIPSDHEDNVDTTKAVATLPWHMMYHHITNSHLLELGFPIRKVRDTVIQNLLGQLQDPNYNPNLLTSYAMPIFSKVSADRPYFQNWADVKDAFTDDYENRTTLEQDNSYGVEARAAASFLPGINSGGLSGDAAWNWISSRVSPGIFVNWAFLPRGTVVPPTDTTPPSAPTNLSATVLSSTQINLSWTASTDAVGVTGYRVERCSGSATCSTYTQISTPSTNSYSDTGLTASTIYRYRVRATDAAGNLSAYSNVVNGTTPTSTTPPPPPISTKFIIGQRVQTTSNLNVRATASATGTLLGTKPLGSLGTIVSGGVQSGSSFWWNVNYDTAPDGWSVEDFLTSAGATPIPGDLNADHIINSLDFSLLNSRWNQNFSIYDLLPDGLINSLDFAIMSSNWGRTW